MGIQNNNDKDMQLAKHLDRALAEHDLRQQTTKAGIEYISNMCREVLSDLEPNALKNIMIGVIRYDQMMQDLFDAHFIDSDSSYPLKTNKNQKLFEDSKKLLNSNDDIIEYIISGDYKAYCPLIEDCKTVFPQHKNFASKTYTLNAFGSSKINQWQYLATTALRAGGYEDALKKEYHTKYSDLSDYDNSPYRAILQGVGFDPFHIRASDDGDINIAMLTERSMIYHNLEDWFYIQENGDGSKELLTLTMGFSFGGSRYDSRYKKFPLHNEDCSSAVSKWLGIDDNLYSTSDFTYFYLKYDSSAHPINYNDLDQIIEYQINEQNLLEELAEHIKPKFNNKPNVGDLVVFRSFDQMSNSISGHIGIVSGYDDNAKNFEYLSYNRDLFRKDNLMEGSNKENCGFEGLGYSTQDYYESGFFLQESSGNTVKQMFFEVI